jgi:hypothetical protein
MTVVLKISTKKTSGTDGIYMEVFKISLADVTDRHLRAH